MLSGFFAGEWPAEAIWTDLLWHAEEVSAGRLPRFPGRETLAGRWRCSADLARKALEAWKTSAPALRQDGASAAPAAERSNAGNGDERASSAPALRQEDASAPAPRQPRNGRTPGTEKNAPAPRQRRVRVHEDEEDQSDLDLPTSSSGVQGENPPEVLFLEVFRRWRFDPQAPVRWRETPAEALAWFRAEAAAVVGVDLEKEVRAFGRWLDTKSREPVRVGAARFPTAWKNTLISWLQRAAEPGRTGNDRPRRGADPAGAADYGGIRGRGASGDDFDSM